MPLPLIPIAIALIVTGGTGTAFGADGVTKMSKAKARHNRAKELYASEYATYAAAEAECLRDVEEYGRQQLKAQAETLGAWLLWLEKNERKVRRLDRTYVDGVQVQVPNLPTLRVKVVQAKGLIEGSVSAAFAAVVAQQSALMGVRSLAAAGTGTAIAGLSGAAAESATLAWLGGGTLAAGGGGVAAGGMVLTGFAVAPALLIGGITLSIQGERALTQAREYQAQVNVACEEMHTMIELFSALRRRVLEMRRTLNSMQRRAMRSLQELESLDFDPAKHAEQFQQTALLMAAVGQILSTPLLDSSGNVSTESLRITERFAA